MLKKSIYNRHLKVPSRSKQSPYIHNLNIVNHLRSLPKKLLANLTKLFNPQCLTKRLYSIAMP